MMKSSLLALQCSGYVVVKGDEESIRRGGENEEASVRRGAKRNDKGVCHDV